jgi:hypothetical protein
MSPLLSRSACLALIATSLSGCGKLADLRASIEELTEGFVAQGVVSGVVPPSDPLVAEALVGTDFEGGATSTFYLSSISPSGGFGQPIGDAELFAFGEGGVAASFSALGGGQYRAGTEEGLAYIANTELEISAHQGGQRHEMAALLPPAPRVNVPETLPSGMGLVIDAAGQGFDGLSITVLDLLTGATTWSNELTSVEAIYALSQGQGSVTVELPPEAFPVDGRYLVGVSGLVVADTADWVEVNARLSTLLTGQFFFHSLCVGDDPLICALAEEG